jgi:phage protein D
MGKQLAIAVNGIPDEDLVQAGKVEVQERMGETTTYRLRYDVEISGGDLPLLIDGRLDPGSEIAVQTIMNGTTHCLVKGPVGAQQIRLEQAGAGSWVEVQGSDSSIVMDRETRSAIWEDVTDSDAVSSILQNYGYVLDVMATNAGHLKSKHALAQRDSDLRFVHRLAKRNGFFFWITSDAQGTETAHFKRPPLDGEPAAELVINQETANLKSLDINWDVERPTSVEGLQLDLNSKTDLDGSVAGTPQTILGDKGLKAITNDTRSVLLAAPADDAGDLQARGEGALIEADWFIRATCQTDLETLGKLVRAHTIIEILGAGSRYSGKYLVAGVRHIIDATEHRMEIELVRNGWGG